MKNVLKASIITNNNAKKSSFSKVQPVINGFINSNDIINELLKDGMDINRQIIHDIVTLFNKTVAKKVVSGYIVDTGLIKLTAEIKNPVFDKNWNPYSNRINISIEYGDDLVQAINDTTVEIMEEEVDKINTNAINIENTLADNLVEVKVASEPDHYSNINNDNPACGIAFRKWLCKS